MGEQEIQEKADASPRPRIVTGLAASEADSFHDSLRLSAGLGSFASRTCPIVAELRGREGQVTSGFSSFESRTCPIVAKLRDREGQVT